MRVTTHPGVSFLPFPPNSLRIGNSSCRRWRQVTSQDSGGFCSVCPLIPPFSPLLRPSSAFLPLGRLPSTFLDFSLNILYAQEWVILELNVGREETLQCVPVSPLTQVTFLQSYQHLHQRKSEDQQVGDIKAKWYQSLKGRQSWSLNQVWGGGGTCRKERERDVDGRCRMDQVRAWWREYKTLRGESGLRLKTTELICKEESWIPASPLKFK